MKKHIGYIAIILLAFMPLATHGVHATESDNIPKSLSPLAVQAININNADIDTLALLKGVGVKKAQAIVNYRELHGKFKSIDELLNVKGIGKQMLEHNRANIKL